ncbi:MAG: ABC transporter permease [Planctomycetota bacterium]
MSRWAVFANLTGFVAAGIAFFVTPGFLVGILASLVAYAAWVTAVTQVGRVLPPLFTRAATTMGEFMMRIVDIAYALPFMFLVILLMISFGRDLFTLFVALGAVQWLTMARIVRGQSLSLKEKEFVEAARMGGASHTSILFRHIIPNTLGVVVVYSTLTVPAVILQESFLAFIGLTVELNGRTLDSWGSLVSQGRDALTSTGGNWWVLLFPSLAMAITLFSLNFFGDGLRDALDPQLKGRT